MRFDFSLRTRIVFGPNVVDRVGSLAGELGARRVFLVTDPGIVAAGHVERTEKALVDAGIKVRRFDQVDGNPTSTDVDACREALGDWDAEILIGLGGGSSIDLAKGCNFLRGGGGMEDYWGIGKAKGELLPLIAIPTTAGTGSEVQSFALIEQNDTHQKMACGDLRATPAIAILDPTLTVTQPQFVTACTGLDAVGHAVETAVTTKRNSLSSMFSREAFLLAQASLPRVLQDPEDLEARGHMLRAAAYAGIAIENSMLGASHSMANPLTARHGIAHGQAVATTLPVVVRYNGLEPGIAAIYAELARSARLCDAGRSDDEAVEALVSRLDALLEAAGFARSLGALDVPESALDALAAEAARQWTAQFNPRKVDRAEFRELLAEAWAPERRDG